MSFKDVKRKAMAMAEAPEVMTLASVDDGMAIDNEKAVYDDEISTSEIDNLKKSLDELRVLITNK